MLLSFSSDQARDDYRDSIRVKFVMIAGERNPDPNETRALVFSHEDTHAVRAAELLKLHPGMTFVGGGKIEGSRLWWESESCADAYGYDRPAPATAEHLLLELEEALDVGNGES